MQKPKNIKLAIGLLWAGLGLIILAAILSFFNLTDFLNPRISFFSAAAVKWLRFSIFITCVLINLISIYAITKQQNWIRIFYLVFAIATIFNLPITGYSWFQLIQKVFSSHAINITQAITTIYMVANGIVITALTLITIFLLFSKEGSLWFKKGNASVPYKETDRFTRWLKVLLYSHIVSIGISLFVPTILVFYQQPVVTNISNLHVNTTFIRVIRACDIFSIVTWLLAMALFLVWVYKANEKAHRSEATAMRFSKWSIIWFFIPVINLWKPYQMIKEIWQVAKNPLQWREQSAPALLKWWWFLTIILPVALLQGQTIFFLVDLAMMLCLLALIKEISQMFYVSDNNLHNLLK